MRRLLLIAPLLLLVTACDDNLKKVAQTLDIVAASVGTLQKTVIESNKVGFISDDDTKAIVELCVKMNLAGKEAVAATRNVAKLSPEDQVRLVVLLQPVVTAVDNALDKDIVGIKNPETKQKVQTVLTGIQSALRTAQVLLVK